ncbi:hypothetical protein ACFQH9_10425 [Pseudonocardia lutea]|uniref:Uncharacterized protein n=1 Tax=Pseudonocardia lutea TaxID=2172015 RepID=A0ABW1I6V7_9PSEU
MSGVALATVLVALTLVAVSGAAVVVTMDPARQAVTLSVFGLALAVLFFVLQAPTWRSPRSPSAPPSSP